MLLVGVCPTRGPQRCSKMLITTVLDSISLQNAPTVPQSNHEEKIRQIPLEGPSTMFLTSTPENCQGHGKQEKPEDMSQLRAQGRMTVKCHVASCQGERDELEDWD